MTSASTWGKGPPPLHDTGGVELSRSLLPCQSSSLIVGGRAPSPKGFPCQLCIESSIVARGEWDNQLR